MGAASSWADGPASLWFVTFSVVENVNFKRNEMQKLLPEFQKMIAAKEALEASPNDQGTNEQVGYYYAFVRS